MTKQETFKRRIRARMEKTGERYGAARRVLLERSYSASGRQWVASPELSEETVSGATGRGWDEWCDLIDAWSGRDQGHTAIALYLQSEHGVDSWWAQSVTLGYERITGRRLPYQQPDGTFNANKSRTVTTDAEALREMILDDSDRRALFPGFATELRSRPTSKALRISIGPGRAQITMDPQADGKVKVTVTHEGLPSPGDVDEWKAYWSDWLEALNDD